MTPAEIEETKTAPPKKTVLSLRRTKDFYSKKISDLYNEAVENKHMSQEEAYKERDVNVAKIRSITQPEYIQIWYEKNSCHWLKLRI